MYYYCYLLKLARLARPSDCPPRCRAHSSRQPEIDCWVVQIAWSWLVSCQMPLISSSFFSARLDHQARSAVQQSRSCTAWFAAPQACSCRCLLAAIVRLLFDDFQQTHNGGQHDLMPFLELGHLAERGGLLLGQATHLPADDGIAQRLIDQCHGRNAFNDNGQIGCAKIPPGQHDRIIGEPAAHRDNGDAAQKSPAPHHVLDFPADILPKGQRIAGRRMSPLLVLHRVHRSLPRYYGVMFIWRVLRRWRRRSLACSWATRVSTVTRKRAFSSRNCSTSSLSCATCCWSVLMRSFFTSIVTFWPLRLAAKKPAIAPTAIRARP